MTEFKQIIVINDYTIKQQTKLRSNINEATKIKRNKEKDIKHAVRFNQSTKKSTYIQKYRHIQNNQ